MLKRIPIIFFFIFIALIGQCAVAQTENSAQNEDFIKWVDFNPTFEALDDTLTLDIESKGEDIHLNWIELLAYLASKYGGDFSKYKKSDLKALADSLNQGKSIDKLTESFKHYPYYLEAYTAVLGEFVGDYDTQQLEDGELVWKRKYGLKVFSPIAKNYSFQHYDDFGSERSYGFKRKHLGHDMMASVGTPVVAVETGKVEVMGWNQYGGWRIGLRSADQKRYYYYAHLRKNHPFNNELKEGDTVKAGDVIGYVGRTGYSTNENTNNIKQSHLHFGIQLIFDESQEKGATEIWIDAYNIARLLQKNKSEVFRDEDSKDYYRRYDFKESLSETNSATELAEEEKKRVAIVMYHRVSASGDSGKYIIKPEQLEADLKYLKEEGYETVVMGDLIDFVKDGRQLPDKAVVLTFDDGNYSDYKYLYPMLKKYGMRAVVSIIGKPTDEYTQQALDSGINYPNLTWSQAKQMMSDGTVEIQSHSYNLHGKNGSQKLYNESEQEYKQRLKKDLEKMQIRAKEMLGVEPTTFTYPLGKITECSYETLQELGIESSLSCYEGFNTLSCGKTEDLYQMKRCIRSPERPIKEILAEFNRTNE